VNHRFALAPPLMDRTPLQKPGGEIDSPTGFFNYNGWNDGMACTVQFGMKIGRFKFLGSQTMASMKIATLISNLRNSSFEVREVAARDLAKLAEQAEDAIPFLIENLNDPVKCVRKAAAFALSQVRTDPQAALPALVNALSENDGPTRASAAHAIGNYRRLAAATRPSLLAVANDEDADVRRWVLRALEEIAIRDEKADAILLARLHDSVLEIQINAVAAVAKLATRPVYFVSELIPFVSSQNSRLQSEASHALGLIGPMAKAAVPALRAQLDCGNCYVVKAYWEITGDAGAAVQALVTCLRTGFAEEVCDVLAAIGPDAYPATDGLAGLLKSEDADTRWAAVDALGAIGRKAVKAMPALLEALGDKSGLVSSRAMIALRDIGPECISPLSEALEHDNPLLRENAADALSKFGRMAISAAEILRKRIGCETGNQRCWMAIAHAKIGSGSRLC
jgi:HEAT repeat protein